MSRPRGGANHCSVCGALNRTNRTHLEGMTRTEHEKGAISYCRRPNNSPSGGGGNAHTPRSAEARAADTSRREAWVGRLVTMPDATEWLVTKHINGSLYEVTSQSGTAIRHAAHPTEDSDWRWWSASEDGPRAPQPETPPMTRQEAMDALDEAVRDAVAQEDEAATMAPPTLESDRVEIEMLGARLEYEDGHMFVVFRVGREFFYGRLDKYEPPEFDPLDLIRKPEDE